MSTLTLSTIGAPQALAEAIEGFSTEPIAFTHDDLTIGPVRADRTFTELRFLDDDGRSVGAVVTIQRGEQDAPATVSFSSSSSRSTGTADARRTAELLRFAAETADLLNTWAEDGQLPRLGAPDEPRVPPVWVYVFPDAVENGRSKTITRQEARELSHGEIEDLIMRYGATTAECTPPTARVAS